MDPESAKDMSTRERLLKSACDLFAEKGFTKTTNKDICEKADANIAAVNYYFGSKENLYAEAWRKAFRDSMEAHPPDGGVPEDAPPEQRLRGRIRAMVHTIADEDNQAFLIAHKEMANPTALLKDVKRECVEPLVRRMEEIVTELLGPQATEKHVRFCQASIGAQCFGILRHVRTERQSGGPCPPPPEELITDVDGYA
jgi:AcrR family transcriptional regulator